MALKFKVKDLKDVPEAQHALYRKLDGDAGYVLDAEGAKGEDDIAALEAALSRERTNARTFKGRADKFTAEVEQELEDLRRERREREEGKLKGEGQWDKLRDQLQADHAKEIAKLQGQLGQRDKVIERLTITTALDAATEGVLPEYKPAVRALLKERGTKVLWEGDEPKGVISDPVHGDKPIGEYVSGWLKTDEAKAYLPAAQKPGGGAPGTGGKGGGTAKSYEGKKYGEMTMDEKKDYLRDQAEAGKTAGATA